jgi:hypothetical protein
MLRLLHKMRRVAVKSGPLGGRPSHLTEHSHAQNAPGDALGGGAIAICTFPDSDEDRAPIRVECGGATGARRPRPVRSHNLTAVGTSGRRTAARPHGVAKAWGDRELTVGPDELRQRPSSRRRGRSLREAKRQPLIEDCDVRPRDCVPMQAGVPACSRSTAQQTPTTAAELELGSDDGLDGTIGFDGNQLRDEASSRDRFSMKAFVRARDCTRPIASAAVAAERR